MPTVALEELVEDGALLAAVPVDPGEEFEGRVPPCEDAADWEVWLEDAPEAEVEADVVEGGVAEHMSFKTPFTELRSSIPH